MKKVVVIGGGSGLSTLLRGLRDYPLDITAIVTMTDDGASTGRLRRDLNILPPGDIRKCIAALSDNETLLTDLFQYRFQKGLGLKGHNFGNLWITALKEMTGSFELAVEETGKILSIRGQVLPSTLEDVHLVAEFANGKKVAGESRITKYGYDHKIKNITINKKAHANGRAIAAIQEADVVLVGPGSLFTSIIPNFLLPEIKDAVARCSAPVVYICNVSTERGETEEMGLRLHCETMRDYGVNFDAVVFNNKYFPAGSGDGYVRPVISDCDKCDFCSIALQTNLVNEDNPLYHDAEKLGAEIYKLVSSRKLKRR